MRIRLDLCQSEDYEPYTPLKTVLPDAVVSQILQLLGYFRDNVSKNRQNVSAHASTKYIHVYLHKLRSLFILFANCFGLQISYFRVAPS